MKPKYILIAVGIITGLVLLRIGVEAMRAANHSPSSSAQSNTPNIPAASLPDGQWAQKPDIEKAVETLDSGTRSAAQEAARAALIQEYGFSPEKIAALRASIDNEPRTPPIKRTAPRPLPTPEELADPELYAQYEELQEQRFLAGFVKSVDPKIAQINAHMEELEQHDFPERDKYRQIADEKIQALEEMKAKLLEEKPELASIETPLLDLSQFENPQ